jgi:glycosyltransferase involved in cell wall biosynthesis
MMSTYNGSKYIEEQIQSILHQKDVNIFLKIRDDGSNDSTISILERYDKENNITVEYCENIGWKRSFMQLAYKSDKYDFYAFSDQDDVWDSQKLIKAIIKLEHIENPVLYYSNSTMVKEKLDVSLGILGVEAPKSNLMTLTQNFALGCTIVINKEMMEIVKRYQVKYPFAHDIWIPILSKYFGKIIYDKESSIFYRQHQSNAEGGERKGIITQFKDRMKNHINHDNYYYYALEILNGYSDLLNDRDLNEMNLIINSKKRLKAKIKLLSHPNFKKNTIKGTIFLKILCLLDVF